MCTTKISALLVLKLFSGWDILIYIGIITSIYGILFSLFDNNIKRTVLYVILSEIGVVLLFIGVEGNTLNTTLISIINDDARELKTEPVLSSRASSLYTNFYISVH